MRRPLTPIVFLSALALVGCADPSELHDEADAAVSEPDAFVEPDASEALDAGGRVDAGAVVGFDGGPRGEDVTSSLDAGTRMDAGTPSPDVGTPRPDVGTPRPDVGTPRPDTGPPGPTVVERSYRVLHWNIAGGKENDCQTALITRAVVRYARENDVDFVGLNEVCPGQFESIEAALRDLWRLGPRVDIGAYIGDERPAIVGNAIFSRLGIQSVTRQMVGEDQYGNRNLLCAQVPALPHLRFCSTHLTPGDSAARTQLGRVLDRLEQWWDDRRDTVILSGDLNLTANDPGLNTLYTAAANTRNNPDNRGRYHELDDADPEHCVGYGERSQPGATAGPCSQGAKIDFIFVRENRIVDDAYAGDTFDIPTDCTGVCSDHRAVFGRVRVRVEE